MPYLQDQFFVFQQNPADGTFVLPLMVTCDGCHSFRVVENFLRHNLLIRMIQLNENPEDAGAPEVWLPF